MRPGASCAQAAGPFQRGLGLRSSASARVVSLGGGPGQGAVPLRPLARHFCEWPAETVAAWLAEVGLAEHAPAALRRVPTGRFLLNMSLQDMERELGIRRLLHRKKLRCLLNAIDRNTHNQPEPADNMDTHQVGHLKMC